jgi:valyl-tRNA synthetase
LARASTIEAGSKVVKPPFSASAVLTDATLFVPLGGVIDLDVERARLAKEKGRLSNLIQGAQTKLANESFVARAKPEIVAAERDKLQSLRGDLAKVETAIADLTE